MTKGGEIGKFIIDRLVGHKKGHEILSPKIVDKEAKREQIAQAAMAVFARMGINDAKMADIAVEAGVGKGTIYEYFRSKDEVFAASFELLHGAMGAEVGKRMWGLSNPEEKMRVMVQGFVDLSMQHIDYMEIMFEFWAEGIRRGKQALDLKSMYDQYRDYITAILEEGIEAGAFRPMKAKLVASSLLAALDGLFLQWVLDKEGLSLVEAGEELTEVFLKGIKA